MLNVRPRQFSHQNNTFRLNEFVRNLNYHQTIKLVNWSIVLISLFIDPAHKDGKACRISTTVRNVEFCGIHQQNINPRPTFTDICTFYTIKTSELFADSVVVTTQYVTPDITVGLLYVIRHVRHDDVTVAFDKQQDGCDACLSTVATTKCVTPDMTVRPLCDGDLR